MQAGRALACLVLAILPLAIAQQPEKIEPVKTSITVTEKISAEAPANVTTVPAERIQDLPGSGLDDRLRDVPGFSLFRRSSSIVAHPTTQGVSLRGIGSSGASRSLLLWDAIPANDPFGGWVYWTQFPPYELERIEIQRGASTSVYGDRALGGAIALFSRPAQRHWLEGSYEGGNRDTHDASAGFSNLWSRWAISGYGRAFTTDGYYIVPEPFRGSIDRYANVRFATGDVRVDYMLPSSRLFWKANLLAEERINGTMLTNNSTGMGTVSMHYQFERPHDVVSLAGFHTREQFHSTFSSVSADRNTERITFRQTVPAEGEGGSGLWQHSGGEWNVLGGADIYRVEGYSTDRLVPTGERVGGGTQLQHGVFAQADARLGPARFFLGGRHTFTGQGRKFFSPSGGFSAGGRRLRARGSVYRAFRAPTLNELFREFRVGNTATLANPLLRPETMFGAELGVDYIGERSNVRLTFYRNALDDLITNVTLIASPTQTVRQRQNAVSAVNRGMELNTQFRWREFRADAGYLLVDSRFANGARVPQIPLHQGSADITWQHSGTFALFGVRSYSSQFEDERNLRTQLMPGYASVQLLLRQEIVRNLSASVAVENMLDRQYITGFTPTPTIGAPRLWKAGVRWQGKIF